MITSDLCPGLSYVHVLGVFPRALSKMHCSQVPGCCHRARSGVLHELAPRGDLISQAERAGAGLLGLDQTFRTSPETNGKEVQCHIVPKRRRLSQRNVRSQRTWQVMRSPSEEASKDHCKIYTVASENAHNTFCKKEKKIRKKINKKEDIS